MFVPRDPVFNSLGRHVSSPLSPLIHDVRSNAESQSVEAQVLALAAVIKRRDPNTQAHCQRLAALAVATGTLLGLTADDLTDLRHGSYLHDLGKIAVAKEILWKSSPLTRVEFGKIQEHPLIGDRLCEALPICHRVRPIIRSHHEHLDGSGYPDGLRGDRIPLLVQIISIADVYDAITSKTACTKPH